jgi:MFS family permease
MTPDTVPARPRSVFRHPLVLSFYLPSLLLSVCNGLIVPVLPLFVKELQVSYGLIGLVLGGEGIGMLLGDVPAGIVARRVGRKGAMLLGVGGAVLSTAALFWTRSVAAAVLLRTITGFSGALYTVARHAYVADAVATGTRGRAISLFGGLMRIGRFLGPMLGGVIAAAFGLRATFLAYSALNTVSLAAMAAFVPTGRHTGRQVAQAAAAEHASFLALLKAHWRVLASAGLGQLFAQTIRAGRGAIIPLYAADVIGLDVQAIGLVVSLASAVDMSLFAVAGLLMDRLGRKFAIVPSFAIQALGMFLVPFTGSFSTLLLATMLIGFGNGLGSGTMMTLGADLSPTQSRGEFLGIWRLIGDGGHASGPVIVGQVADVVALPMAAWAMSAAGLMAAMVFAFLVPETLKTRQAAVRRT